MRADDSPKSVANVAGRAGVSSSSGGSGSQRVFSGSVALGLALGGVVSTGAPGRPLFASVDGPPRSSAACEYEAEGVLSTNAISEAKIAAREPMRQSRDDTRSVYTVPTTLAIGEGERSSRATVFAELSFSFRSVGRI